MKDKVTQDLRDAIVLLKLWMKSEWKDFIQENPSVLSHHTKMFLESVEEERLDEG